MNQSYNIGPVAPECLGADHSRNYVKLREISRLYRKLPLLPITIIHTRKIVATTSDPSETNLVTATIRTKARRVTTISRKSRATMRPAVAAIPFPPLKFR